MADHGSPNIWRDFIPHGIWGVLGFAFGFEGVAHLLDGEFIQAALGGIGFLVCAAIVIHIEALRQRAQQVGRSWPLAGAVVLSFAIILSPFIEQRRWPFTETARSFTQKQVDKKIADATKPLIDRLATANDTIKDLQSKLERRVKSAQALTSSSPQPTPQGPINWNFDGQFLVVTDDGPASVIHVLLLQGTSTTSIRIKEAYVVSGLTGHRLPLLASAQKLNGREREDLPVNQVDIPPQADVWLELPFKPPISIGDFLGQWGTFKMTVIYEGAEKPYEHEFGQHFVEEKVHQQLGDAFSPHVTPREQ
jgi:hypothetical protein